jgi:chemotaxis protein methyltransferase CheR
MTILATDIDSNMIARAREGCYEASSLRELPREWKAPAFLRQGGRFCVRPEVRERVAFFEQDIRTSTPEGFFHLIFCRNVAFTYFDAGLQQEVLARICDRLIPGGALVIGIHETLPAEGREFSPWPGCPGVYRKTHERAEL